MIELELVPLPGRPSFYAALDSSGRTLVRASRQPFLDAARALAAMGMPPGTLMAARHRGSAIVAMRSIVGEAAKWRIEEKDRGGLRKRPWLPFEMARLSAQGVPENGAGAVPTDDRPSGGRRTPSPTIAPRVAAGHPSEAQL